MATFFHSAVKGLHELYKAATEFENIIQVDFLDRYLESPFQQAQMIAGVHLARLDGPIEAIFFLRAKLIGKTQLIVSFLPVALDESTRLGIMARLLEIIYLSNFFLGTLVVQPSATRAETKASIRPIFK